MSHLIGDRAVKPVIFREYIGMKRYPKSLNKFPSHIVNREIDEFHFILGFARENHEKGKGTGYFNANWNFEFFGEQKVKDFKDQFTKKDHSNVKVVISIGGRDVGDTKYPFSPVAQQTWCNNAFNSLKNIIQRYNGSDANGCRKLIDGIDINYEHINTDDEQDFSEYIGEVITRLKKDKIIDVVSIAPSHETQKYYRPLYSSCSEDIDWVNYQFYMQPIPTKAEFLNLFYNLSKLYSPKKLLAGASTDPCDADNLSQDVFLESCPDLVRWQSLSGIFIWNANNSASNSNDEPFSLEKSAQNILTENMIN